MLDGPLHVAHTGLQAVHTTGLPPSASYVPSGHAQAPEDSTEPALQAVHVVALPAQAAQLASQTTQATAGLGSASAYPAWQAVQSEARDPVQDAHPTTHWVQAVAGPGSTSRQPAAQEVQAPALPSQAPHCGSHATHVVARALASESYQPGAHVVHAAGPAPIQDAHRGSQAGQGDALPRTPAYRPKEHALHAVAVPAHAAQLASHGEHATPTAGSLSYRPMAQLTQLVADPAQLPHTVESQGLHTTAGPASES